MIVPIAELAASVVDAMAGCSAGTVEVGEGGGEDCSMALDCICGACSMAVEVVNSVGVTIDGSSVVEVEVAAVRARERVHRLPFTVVIDSCGEAMQATLVERNANKGSEEETKRGHSKRCGRFEHINLGN